MQTIAFFIFGLIVSFLLWVVAYLPVMGIVKILLGEWSLGLLYLLPFICLVGFLFYDMFVKTPERIRKEKLHHMYHYPNRIGKNESSSHWHSEFMAVIKEGISTTSDPNKQTDLHHCQKIVEKMSKDNIFSNFNRVFRLTGCHLQIFDSDGRSIAKIV